MQWIKASERLPASSNLVHLTYGKKLGEFKTTGYYEDDTWHYQNGETVTIAGNLHWLDESPPASTEEEAARMYPPDPENDDWYTDGQVSAMQQQAHIACARMYTGEIDKGAARIKELEDHLRGIYEMYGDEWTNYAQEWTEKVLRIAQPKT